MNLKKGFTLIELLVVVAIIGILAAVVLGSLNTARSKGADASIKANLSGARASAELFYDVPQSYDGVCALTGANTIGAAVRAAEFAYDGGATTYADGTASTFDNAQCHDSANPNSAWAAIVPLKASANGAIKAWCVDSTGASREVTTALAASTYACPAS